VNFRLQSETLGRKRASEMNPFLVALIQVLEPVALGALKSGVDEVSQLLDHAVNTHPNTHPDNQHVTPPSPSGTTKAQS
jgi:hypothetical protein